MLRGSIDPLLTVNSEEMEAIREMAAEFADQEVAPRAGEWDRNHDLDFDVVRKAGELGLLGMLVPEEYGGTGLGNLALCLVLEELNRADASFGVTVSVHSSLGTGPITRFGSEEAKKKYLPRLATGEWIAAYSLSEAESGSDAASLTCRAERKGDGLVIDGTKLWVTTGDHAQVIVVFVRTGQGDRPADGITAAIVESTFPGFRVGKVEDKLGIRASHTCELIFEKCEVPPENILGKVDHGFRVAMHTLDGGRIGIASQALGIGRAALEASVRYSQERKQFGRTLSRFQAIQHKLADMATRLDASRLLTHRAAWMKDQDLPHSREAAMAKLMSSQMANQNAADALQIHAGVGFTTDFPVERYFRDARITEIYEGTTEIQKLVIARSLLRSG